MKNRLLIWTAVILLAFLFCFLSCCDDCPTCPQSQPKPVSDYDFYMASYSEGPGFHVYNTRQMGLTRYYPAQYIFAGVAISADGSKLLTTARGIGLIVYSLPEMDSLMTIAAVGGLEVSNTGAYVAVVGDSLVFLDGTSFNVLFTDSVYVGSGRFLLDDSKFYCIHNDKIRIYDMASRSVDSEFVCIIDGGYSPWVVRAQPNADGSVIYILAQFGGIIDRYLISYYPERDSVGMGYKMGPSDAYIILTPDGRQIVAVDGSKPDEFIASGNIIFIDTQIDRPIAIISAIMSIVGDTIPGFDPGGVTVTPDSRYALITPGPGGPWSVFGVIDLDIHKFVDIEIHRPDSLGFLGAWCQKFRK